MISFQTINRCTKVNILEDIHVKLAKAMWRMCVYVCSFILVNGKYWHVAREK